MPTELDYETSQEGRTLTEVGYEYGVTTGRRRRCGWFDGVIARYATRVNGLTDIALTTLDVLSEFDTIKVCVAYDCDGVRYTSVPEHAAAFASAVPVYEELPGWKCDIGGIKKYEDLPENARKYVEFAEKGIGVPITMVSNGPGRHELIHR